MYHYVRHQMLLPHWWLPNTSSHRPKSIRPKSIVWLLGVDIHLGQGWRQVPLYKAENWNQTICLQEDHSCMNNFMEEWQNRFQSLTWSHHPQIHLYTKLKLLKEQGIMDVVKTCFQTGVWSPDFIDSCQVWWGLCIKSLIQQYTERYQRFSLSG
jgi:hypothetical protein